MDHRDAQAHWDRIYRTKQPHEVSWTQDVPSTSLAFIRGFNLPKSAHVIDIGGGDSKLVDFLLDEGYEHITVLDISASALQRARERLGAKADRVQWVVSDITSFEPDTIYDLWHDRAAFHFLTTEKEIAAYMTIARGSLSGEGYLTIGTFSTDGPTKCSGLPIKQYSEEALTHEVSDGFAKLKCLTEDHETPFHTKQNFLFCSFKRTLC
ncbi:MAG: class I SAM-dependent methyltransferase [Flavobacteriales bacterium]